MKTIHGLQNLMPTLREDSRKRERRLKEATKIAAINAEDIIRAHMPEAFGDLKGSVAADGAKVTIDAPHAQPVNFGSRPHMPPVEPLIRWCALRGFQDPKGAAWAIAYKIAERGTPAFHYMENSWQSLIDDLERLVKAALPDR